MNCIRRSKTDWVNKRYVRYMRQTNRQISRATLNATTEAELHNNSHAVAGKPRDEACFPTANDTSIVICIRF